MTETESIEVEEVDSIERSEAMRPWSLNEVTELEASQVDGMHRRLDTVFVPRGVQEPVDHVEALFTVNPVILARRELAIEEMVAEITSAIEGDPRLEEYVVWEHIEPRVEVARIDDQRARVRIEWSVRGGEE